MDISYWKTLNPTLKFVETKKIFFNEYLYTIKIKTNYLRGFAHFKGNAKTYYSTMTKWAYLGKISFNKKFIEDSYDLNQFLYKKYIIDKKYKHRIEEPFVTFYLDSEQEIELMLKDLEANKKIATVTRISMPDKKFIDDLKDGSIILKKINSKYKYKVTVNSGPACDEQLLARRQLADYLYNLGDAVLTKGSILGVQRYWYSASHFYCTDDKVIIFAKLIAPDLIGKTFKVITA